ncbi:thioredoxin family protein [Ramlibacter sp.]|uniref:thioredoxin family protein n=1 Tax=Ramlibacter sp. TaxID=1917967 RepID=UPI002C064639|nr:thioredoxin fold domain-containing protein [Ramlibacter sp.]HWI82114.1 thioredoxin fold domain-containing protein [Ramlibacter sp.]
MRNSSLVQRLRAPVFGALLAGAVLAVQPVHAAAPAGIDWQPAASAAEVDRAFALARQSGRPVFLYWGAVWCPPCNQVKATLFARPDFIERSRAFVPVYVDGDKPGAQKVAARFKVTGYPTMILFRPDGAEITRLPGEVDPERYLLTLTAGLNAQTPVKELLQRALARQALSAEQWRLLAFYSWDTDAQQVLAAAELPGQLAALAAAVPAELPQVRDRLALKSLVASATAEPPAPGLPVEAGRQLLDRLLAQPESMRQLADLLVGAAEPLVKHVAATPQARAELAGRWDAALARLAQQPGRSRPEQVDLLDARVALWKLAAPAAPLAPAQRQEVLREVARLAAATTDKYERQAVIPNAAHVLASAGLLDESDELLKFELPHAVAPYYHMLGLAGNAKKRNDAKAALDWYERAWRASQGPATRIQWGTGFVNQLLELAPDDVPRVAGAAGAVVGQLGARSETFYERNQRSLQRMAQRLAKWQGSDPARAGAVARIRRQLAVTCARLPQGDPGRANCESVFAKG